MNHRALPWLGLGLIAADLVLLAIAVVAGMGRPLGPGVGTFPGPGTMMEGGPRTGTPQGPGSPGFVAGTTATPRVVSIVATAQLRFVPDVVTVKRGETVTFVVTAMGPAAHEFMVGPAAAVAADTPGTPEIADLGMMGTSTLTYTFDGPGPYAFACHAEGHYEAGMAGTIVVVP